MKSLLGQEILNAFKDEAEQAELKIKMRMTTDKSSSVSKLNNSLLPKLDLTSNRSASSSSLLTAEENKPKAVPWFRKNVLDHLKNIKEVFKEEKGDFLDKHLFMQDIIDYLEEDIEEMVKKYKLHQSQAGIKRVSCSRQQPVVRVLP